MMANSRFFISKVWIFAATLLALWGNATAQHAPITVDEVFTHAAGRPLTGTYEAPWFVGSPWCDPRAYGAVGNGTHDDTSALQSCIDSAASQPGADRNGGVVFLAPGAYKITSTLLLPTGGGTPGYIQNVSLIGSGALNTQLYCYVSGAPCVKVQQNRLFKISSLSLVNKLGSQGTTVGLWLTGPSFGTQTGNAILENMQSNAFSTCFRIGDNSSGAAASEVLWQDVFTANCAIGWKIEAANSLNHNFVMTGCSGCGIAFDVLSANSVYWRGGSFSNSTVADIKLEGPSGAYSIQDMRTEGENRFLLFGGSSLCGNNQQVSLHGNQISPSVNNDGYVIENYAGGLSQLDMRGNAILGKISIGPGSTCMVSLVASSNTIGDSVLFHVNGSESTSMFYSSLGNLQVNPSTGAPVAAFPSEQGMVLPGTSTITPISSISSPTNPQLTLKLSTFSNLGSPADGTLVPCLDCTVTKPCGSGGTGALAKRLSGVWVCN